MKKHLVTTYGEGITIRNELNGNAEIVVKNHRLLYRFVYPMKTLWAGNGIE